jgi:hypothetical protein
MTTKKKYLLPKTLVGHGSIMPALRRLRNEDCKSKASWAVKKDVVTHTHTHTHTQANLHHH